MKNLKKIINESFWQLFVIYAFFVLAVVLGFFGSYAFYFNLFALIIGIFGIFVCFTERNETELKIPKYLYAAIFVLSIILIITFRIIPYLNNSIPLGYDAGLYKYIIEKGLINSDKWIFQTTEPGFIYTFTFLGKILPIDFILKYLFIFFFVVLGISLYFFTKEYFDKNVALITLFIFSISLVQFYFFTYIYYKNLVALSLMLWAFYFLKKEKYLFFAVFGILIGIFHRPTFYIFGLSYLVYTFISPYKNKTYNKKLLYKNILYGFIILLISSLFYLERFRPLILSVLSPLVSSFVSPGESPGTFIDFFHYQFSVLAYLPLALFGFIYLIKNKKFDIFFIYTILLSAIIIFEFFFFNRFIIFLDISMIVLAALGASELIKHKKLGLVIVILLLLSGFILMAKTSINEKPYISEGTFNSIKDISIPSDKYIMGFSKEFSPYLLGWTDNKIIAPGLFDYNFWNEQRWNVFWSDLNASEIKNTYGNAYLFTDNPLNSSCYSEISKNLYYWEC
ncbi:MAG: hypothetical protein AABX48_01060 [Nanoarchaeota archaeon]